jgi:thioredoxin 1
MTTENIEVEKIKEKMMKKMTDRNPDANGTVKQLKTADLQEFIDKNEHAIVDFYATWCPPCKQMDPITKELAAKYNGEIAFGKLNTDEERLAAQQYRIRYIPTFFLFKDGEVEGQFAGAKRKKDFVELIEKTFEDDE